MPQRSVTHASFVVERTYPVPRAKVFAAWAHPATKARWFSGPEEWVNAEHTLDFRVGGREVSRAGPAGGPVHLYEARYYDIVPDERIVYAYDMHLDGKRISVSLATAEFKPAGAGTRLVYTEQGAYLDGFDDPAERQRGTAELQRASAGA